VSIIPPEGTAWSAMLPRLPAANPSFDSNSPKMLVFTNNHHDGRLGYLYQLRLRPQPIDSSKNQIPKKEAVINTQPTLLDPDGPCVL